MLPGLPQLDIEDDGMIDLCIGGVRQPVDLLESFYRLQSMRKSQPATASWEDRAANQAAFLRSVRDVLLPELGFPSPSTEAARKFAVLITDRVTDVKKNSGEAPNSNGSDAPDSSPAE